MAAPDASIELKVEDPTAQEAEEEEGKASMDEPVQDQPRK